MNFDLKKTAIYQAVKYSRNPLFRFQKFFKNLFLILTFFCFLGFLTGAFKESIPEIVLKRFLGGAVLSLTLAIFFAVLGAFFEQKLKRPRPRYSISQALLRPENFNFASFLDFEAAQVIFKTLKFVKKKKKRDLLGLALLYFLTNEKIKEVEFIFGRSRLNLAEIKKQLKRTFQEIKKGKEIKDNFEEILKEAIKITQKRGKERIGVGDILIGFAQIDPFFQKVLIENDLNKEDIEDLAFWYERKEREFSQNRRFWTQENLLKKGSIGKDWASGYTLTLDKYSLDLREKLRKGGFRKIFGHQKELSRVERILEKTEQNNVLLIGEAGTGRRSIIEALVQKVFFGQSGPSLNFKRILELDLALLISEIPDLEEVELTLDKCFEESVEAGNVILVITDFHNFVGQIQRPGTVDISAILSGYLHLPTFQIIALCTYEGLHQIIERNPTLSNLFEKVEVSEISPKETLKFLEEYLPFFERKYKKFIPFQALREIVNLSSRYLTNVPFPKKAIELLDEVMVENKKPIIDVDDVARVLSEKTEIPIGRIEKREREILLNLENLIHQRIINQEEAVKELSQALRRARSGIGERGRPIGTFLFLGPTGVGKTETSKALSSIYFGSEERMIRLDMSEFQNISDIERLIGSERQGGLLTTPVRENPFSVVLLDELEKAHPNILNLFLQVLDEGQITDGRGRKVDFKNTIIIGTSNAGAEVIREDIRHDRKLDIVRDDLLDFLFKEGIFRPEFINRFDAQVLFKPLSRENLLGVAGLMLSKLAKILKEKGIELEITQALKEKIATLGYNPVFGAREMRRVLQDKVGNLLAEALLSGKLKRGDRVEVDPKEFKLIIKPGG
ncbi:MAG: ATP-dependent Clp protease ATP-binding subunit [Patescibacteria group bacterium]|nr:ATP-dependent Clp protease ATP-binding subunit [Patescibacteria group bacterium]